MNDRFSPLRSLPARALFILLLSLALVAAASAPEAQSLLGSRASLLKQQDEAQEHAFSYLQTVADVQDFAQRGVLVRLPGDADYEVADAGFPYARPEVRTFIERLAGQYHGACGEPLVVTSLTRPADRQPRNASPLSVHPTGMAVDLRRSARPACRAWLEKNLLALEGEGVIEATKERHPPHYHIAVFPRPYRQYLASRGAAPELSAAPAEAGEVRLAATSGKPAGKPEKRSTTRRSTRIAHAKVSTSHTRNSRQRVRVGAGDTLWTIAQRHGVSVAAVKRANHIRSSHLKAGQMLAIPAA